MDRILEGPENEITENAIHWSYDEAVKAIIHPLENQMKKRRRNSGLHVNGELLRLYAHKKKLYNRWRWRRTPQNEAKYKEACRRTQ